MAIVYTQATWGLVPRHAQGGFLAGWPHGSVDCLHSVGITVDFTGPSNSLECVLDLFFLHRGTWGYNYSIEIEGTFSLFSKINIVDKFRICSFANNLFFSLQKLWGIVCFHPVLPHHQADSGTFILDLILFLYLADNSALSVWRLPPFFTLGMFSSIYISCLSCSASFCPFLT